MARPIIVAGATTQAGAADGPVQLHGDGPYSRMAGGVKRKLAAGLRSSMSFALCADGHIVPRFDCVTRSTIDEQPAGLAQASRSFSERRRLNNGSGLALRRPDAPWPTKMGTIASPWCYDRATGCLRNHIEPRTPSLAKSKR